MILKIALLLIADLIKETAMIPKAIMIMTYCIILALSG
jgi:hypothetical protein